MKVINVILFTAVFALGCSGCGDSTTIIKKETKIDRDGGERTRIETKTVETTDHSNYPPRDRVIVEEKKDPVVKLGPIEIRK